MAIPGPADHAGCGTDERGGQASHVDHLETKAITLGALLRTRQREQPRLARPRTLRTMIHCTMGSSSVSGVGAVAGASVCAPSQALGAAIDESGGAAAAILATGGKAKRRTRPLIGLAGGGPDRAADECRVQPACSLFWRSDLEA